MVIDQIHNVGTGTYEEYSAETKQVLLELRERFPAVWDSKDPATLALFDGIRTVFAYVSGYCPVTVRKVLDHMDATSRGAKVTRTMGAGNVADDDVESLVFADESD